MLRAKHGLVKLAIHFADVPDQSHDSLPLGDWVASPKHILIGPKVKDVKFVESLATSFFAQDGATGEISRRLSFNLVGGRLA